MGKWNSLKFRTMSIKVESLSLFLKQSQDNLVSRCILVCFLARNSLLKRISNLQDIQSAPHVTVHSLDYSEREQSSTLSAITEMHDRQIVATAFVFLSQGGK
jgi:hypothetical protein